MLASFFSVITAFIAAHPHFAYAAVLLLALSESVPVIGVVVPGTAVILAISGARSHRCRDPLAVAGGSRHRRHPRRRALVLDRSCVPSFL